MALAYPGASAAGGAAGGAAMPRGGAAGGAASAAAAAGAAGGGAAAPPHLHAMGGASAPGAGAGGAAGAAGAAAGGAPKPGGPAGAGVPGGGYPGNMPQPQALPPHMGMTLCPYCSMRMAYPVGAQFIQCPACRLTSQLQLLPTLQLSCRMCRTSLAYTANYALIQCPRCTLIIDTRDPAGLRGTPGGPPGVAGAANAAAGGGPAKPPQTGSSGAQHTAAVPPHQQPSPPGAAGGAAAAVADSKADAETENRLAKLIDEHRAKRQAEAANSNETEMQPMRAGDAAPTGATGQPKPKAQAGAESSWTNLLSVGGTAEPKYDQLTDHE